MADSVAEGISHLRKEPSMALARIEETDNLNDYPSFSISILIGILTPHAISKIVINESGCWIWGLATSEQGYGRVKYKGKMRKVHRLLYELFVDAVPENLVLDHICHDPNKCSGGPLCPHRPCVNPMHLKPVTAKINAERSSWTVSRRKATSCMNGHKWMPETTRWMGKSRVCVLCHG